MIVGLLHPGEMGAAVGCVLRESGHDVRWAGDGRSEATRRRAEEAGLVDAGSVSALVGGADVVLSVCPPHAALDVARAAAGAALYVDANAVSPATARAIAALHPRFVDGGIVGAPPRPGTTARLYLSGAQAALVAGLFEGDAVEPRIVPDASAVKMTYAAWTKGSAALLLAIRDVARAYGVLDALEEEWRGSTPELLERLPGAERSAAAKGWRWAGEMEEVAATFAAAGSPDGFHRAAEVFRA